MMINNWRTAKEIQKDYSIQPKTFAKWRAECEASPYKDAIIRVSERVTYVVEPKWQQFLKYKAQEHKQKTLDPHLRAL